MINIYDTNKQFLTPSLLFYFYIIGEKVSSCFIQTRKIWYVEEYNFCLILSKVKTHYAFSHINFSFRNDLQPIECFRRLWRRLKVLLIELWGLKGCEVIFGIEFCWKTGKKTWKAKIRGRNSLQFLLNIKLGK